MSADAARLALSEIVGEKWVEVEPFASVNLLSDWTNRFHGRPLAIVKPADTAEVSAVLKWANDNNVPVVAQSGNTSLVGGGTPTADGKAVLLSLQRMNKVERIDAVNDTMVVDAGVILQKAQEAARAHGRLFPLSFASEGSACIGGCLATNAGGYGGAPLRQHP